MQLLLEPRGVGQPDHVRGALDLDIARVRDERGQLPGGPVRPNVLAGIDEVTWHAQLGQIAEQGWSLAVRPPARVAQTIDRRIGLEDVPTAIFPDRPEALMIDRAPRAVIDNVAACDADDAPGVVRIAQSIGQRQIGAVAMAEQDPALDAIGGTNG